VLCVVLVLVLTCAVAVSAWSLDSLDGNYLAADGVMSYNEMPEARRVAYSSENTGKLRMECSSVELDLGISIFLENGEFATGIPFEAKVKSADDPIKVITAVDKEMTGQIYIEEIEEGDYIVELLAKDGVTPPSPVAVTVYPKVVYEKIDVKEKVKKASEVNQKEEDAKYGGDKNNNGGSSTVKTDTVEYVPSSQTTTTQTVEKPVLDAGGNQVYRYKPQLSGGYLVNADGSASDIIPVLDGNGYITGAYRVVATDGASQNVDCKGEVLDASGTPLMAGSAYKFKFTRIALTQTVTETVIIYKGWQTLNGKTYYYDKNGKYVTGTQTIQGITYFFSSDGVRGGSIGIDISTWQENIDWKKVKDAGIDFVFVRLGFRGYGSGVLVLDNMYHKHMQGAISVGLRVGVYFFTQAINEREAVEEASMCLEYVSSYRINYPIAIDIEDAGSPTARTNKLTNEQRTKICIAFCETIRNAGYTACVYANKYYFESKLNTSQLNKYVIWLAHYTTASSSSYAGRYDIWQHTSTGRVNGIPGNVDMNISYI